MQTPLVNKSNTIILNRHIRCGLSHGQSHDQLVGWQ